MACDSVGQGRLPEEAVFGLPCEGCAGVSETRKVDSGERRSVPKTSRTETESARSLRSAQNAESGSPWSASRQRPRPCRLWSLLDELGLRAAGGRQALRRSTVSVSEMAVASGEDEGDLEGRFARRLCSAQWLRT